MAKLNAQQEEFVQFYTRDFNATRAAIKAGYSEKSAASLGYQLLQNPLVRKAIDGITKKNAVKHDLIRHRIIEQLSIIAFANLKDYGSFDSNGIVIKPSTELDDDLASAIGEFKVTVNEYGKNVQFKLLPKEKSIELLGKHLGMFTDHIKIEAIKPFVIRRSNGEQLVLGAKVEEEET